MGFGDLLLSQITVTNVTLLLIAYVVLKFLYQIVYYHFFHPLSVFPGPFWGGVTRLWIAWHNLRETELPTVYALTRKYGKAPPCSARRLVYIKVGAILNSSETKGPSYVSPLLFC